MNEPTWTKSSFSVNDNCVEVAHLDGGDVGVRHSKNPDGNVLRFTRTEMRAFLDGAKAGEFDDLT